MAKRQFELSEIEISVIQQREGATRDTRELKRLQGVRLYGMGYTVQQIQELLGCGVSSLREWVQKYQRAGIVGLAAGYGQNAQNASKLSREQLADLRERLHSYQPYQVIGSSWDVEVGQFWTVSHLQVVVEQWYGVRYEDAGSYRNLFHRCGFSYQRAAKIYKSRPSEAQIAEFEAELEKK